MVFRVVLLAVVCFAARAQDGTAVLKQADDLITAGKTSEARALLEPLLKAGDASTRTAAAHLIGLSYFRQGRLDDAEKYFSQALELSRGAGDRKAALKALSNLGVIARRRAQPQRAAEMQEAAIREADALGERETKAVALDQLGTAYFELGRYDDSGRAFDEAEKLWKDLKNEERLGIHYYNHGDALRVQQRLDEAQTRFELCLGIADRLNRADIAAAAVAGIGSILRMRGDFSKALGYQARARKAMVDANRPQAVAGIDRDTGYIYYLLADYEQAVNYYREGLKAALALKDGIVERDIRGRLALALIELKEYAGARAEITRGIEMDEKNGAHYTLIGAYRTAGRLAAEQKLWAEARLYYDKSLAEAELLKNANDILQTLFPRLQLATLSGDHTTAAADIKRLEELLPAAEDPDTTAGGWLALGRYYRKRGDTPAALKSLERAVHEAEQFRTIAGGDALQRTKLFATLAAAHQALAELYVTMGKPREALRMAELAKARVLQETAGGGPDSLAMLLNAAERQEESRLRRRMVQLNLAKKTPAPELKQARLDHAAFWNRAYAAHPEIGRRAGDVAVPQLARMSVPFALEYLVTDKSVVLFVVRHSAVRAHVLAITPGDLQRKVAEFRRLLGSRDPEFRGAAEELYRTLVAPAGTMPPATVVVPDGVLWELPFQALVNPARQYMVQLSAISYAPSLAAHAKMKGPRGTRFATPLFIGDPALTGIEEDLRALAAAFPKAQLAFADTDLREDSVKSRIPRHDLLHFSTHGLLEATAPMYSGLKLLPASDGKEDGELEAWEVARLPLKARLVVLAACESGRGRALKGEGLLGLSWAFFAAGTPSTVVSQWKVDSTATAELFRAFYPHMARADTAPNRLSRALQAAALHLMKRPEYRHPFYWAGFVVMGDSM